MNAHLSHRPRYKLVPEEYLIEYFSEDGGWQPVVIEAGSELIEVPSTHPYWKLILCERKV